MKKNKVNGIRMEVKFITFKNGENIDYYVDENFLKNKIRISENNMKRAYKQRRNSTTVIQRDKVLYFSEKGFKDLINICHKSYRKDTADLLLGKYMNKNKNNKDTITQHENKGALITNRPPLSINILKENGEIFLLSQELADNIDCSPRDFIKTMDKKMFFDKKNYIVKREKRRFKNVAMNKEGFLQICRELRLKEEQYEKILELYK